MMDATSSGIIACFVLAFVIMIAGVGFETQGISPSGFYLFSLFMCGVGAFLIVTKKGGIGSFKIKF